MEKPEYEAFVAGLLAGDKTEFKEWEHNTPYFNGCQPIEVIAASGPQTLRFGPMKPVGLRDPRTGHRPWAVVQLRQDNALGTLWNIVGFQTKLKHAEQVRLFRTIPGLQNAEFARLGGLHRNTFLNSPRLLDATLRLKAMPRLRFAGQITGCEGYVESAAVGLLTGRFAAAERLGLGTSTPPPTTAMGALLGHITGGADATTFQPMNVNFGLFPPIDGAFKGKERKQAMSARALRDFDTWLHPTPLAASAPSGQGAVRRGHLARDGEEEKMNSSPLAGRSPVSAPLRRDGAGVMSLRNISKCVATLGNQLLFPSAAAAVTCLRHSTEIAMLATHELVAPAGAARQVDVMREIFRLLAPYQVGGNGDHPADRDLHRHDRQFAHDHGRDHGAGGPFRRLDPHERLGANRHDRPAGRNHRGAPRPALTRPVAPQKALRRGGGGHALMR